jgi:hypothetical protein
MWQRLYKDSKNKGNDKENSLFLCHSRLQLFGLPNEDVPAAGGRHKAGHYTNTNG